MKWISLVRDFHISLHEMQTTREFLRNDEWIKKTQTNWKGKKYENNDE